MSGPYDVIATCGDSLNTSGWSWWGSYANPQPFAMPYGYSLAIDEVVNPNVYSCTGGVVSGSPSTFIPYAGWDGVNKFNSWVNTFAKNFYVPRLLKPGRQVLIVQAAEPGTDFDAGQWQVPSGSSYTNFVSEVNLAMATNAGNKLVMVGGCFGGNDAYTVETVATYRQYYIDMVTRLRTTDIGINFPFVCGSYSSIYQDFLGGGYVTPYQAALTLPSYLANCAAADMTNLDVHTSVTDDGVDYSPPLGNFTYEHCSCVGQRQMGYRFWQAYCTLTGQSQGSGALL